MLEIWKTIYGFSNYEISNLGRIKRKPYASTDSFGRVYDHKERILSEKISKLENGRNDYKRVKIIRDDGVGINIGVHRLVALMFVPNPYNKPEVDHIDSDRANNVYTNLQWVTKSENMEKAIVPGHNGDTNGNSKLKEAEVLEIVKLLTEGISTCEIARKFSVNRETISKIRRKQTWTYLDCVKNLPDKEFSNKRLKDSEVENICKLIREGKTNPEIANMLGLHRDLIGRIRNKKKYFNLDCVKNL